MTKIEARLVVLLSVLAIAWVVGQDLLECPANAEGLSQSPLPTPTPYHFYKQARTAFEVDKAVAQVGDRLTYTMALTTVCHPANIFFMQTTVPANTDWRDNLQATANVGVYLDRYILWYWPTNPPYPTVITTIFEVEITSLPTGAAIDNEALFFFSEAAGSGMGLYWFTRTVQTLVVTSSTPITSPSPTPTPTFFPSPSPTGTSTIVAPPSAGATPEPSQSPATSTPPPQWPQFLPETGL
ncbi:MAG: hypothetical protein JW953_13250 [Anaerolineae bacterium]|nr:hypothetical protein [Anaerolineae bacterium]